MTHISIIYGLSFDWFCTAQVLRKKVLHKSQSCGVVARVLATDPEIPGSIPYATRFSVK
jgi:hypothetical protein